ncbi:hypothetical protein RND81_06G044200 [Saponaria officinalis]|uniref:Uncharacterized protein n=1 Tax=Saponaria officinalis TaxID=3572 RepID=A0AAW1K7N8_SAPOF
MEETSVQINMIKIFLPLTQKSYNSSLHNSKSITIIINKKKRNAYSIDLSVEKNSCAQWLPNADHLFPRNAYANIMILKIISYQVTRKYFPEVTFYDCVSSLIHFF